MLKRYKLIDEVIMDMMLFENLKKDVESLRKKVNVLWKYYEPLTESEFFTKDEILAYTRWLRENLVIRHDKDAREWAYMSDNGKIWSLYDDKFVANEYFSKKELYEDKIPDKPNVDKR